MRDLVALERDNTYLALPGWPDLVQGIPTPLVQDGYMHVPEKPGLGVELNEEVVKQHLRVPSYFEPTPEYHKFILQGYRPGGAVK